MNETQKQELQGLQLIVFYLQLSPVRWPFESLLSRPDALAAAIQFAQKAGLAIGPDDPDFLPQIAQKITQLLAQEEVVVAPNVPVDIAEKVEQLEIHLAKEAARRERILLTTKEAKDLYGRYQQAIQKQLETSQPALAKNRQLAETVTKEAATKLIAELPPTATETAFEISVPQKEYETKIGQVLQDQFKKAGLKPPEPTVVEKVAARSRKPAAAIAANRQLFPTTPKLARPKTKPLPDLQPLPKEVAEKLAAEVEGTAFRPLIISRLNRATAAPVVSALKTASSNLTPEWQTMIKGIFVEDYQASIAALKEAGLNPNHSIIQQLSRKAEKIRTEQKITLPDGRKVDKPLVKTLKRYYAWQKKRGHWQVREPAIKTHLPRSSPAPINTPWQRFLNRAGTFTGFYRQRRLGPSKTVLRPIIGPLLKNTFGKIATAFKKTKLGQAIVGGAKNIATRIAVQLGAKEAVKAIVKVAKKGASKLIAAGLKKLGLALIPEPVVSKVLLALSFVKDLFWGAIKGFFRRIKGFFADFLPRQTKRATRTASDTATNILAGAGAIAGGFLTLLATTTLIAGAPLALLIGGPLVVIGSLAQLNNQIVSSAFLQEGLGETPGFIGRSIPARPPAEAGHLAESVIYTLNECGIGRVTPGTWSETETCLTNSDLPGKQVIINQFHFSVFQVGPALQCVGFVRGVMGALGLDPGGGRHAGQFLDPPPPTGYAMSTDLSLAQVGDLVIMKGSTYGHIAVVVQRDGRRIRVAQAFGETGGIRITELNDSYFDGFLRAGAP